jgi:hypothetical protein
MMVRADDGPDVIIERLQHVVRIAADIILRRGPRVMAVADGVDFVDVVAHGGVLNSLIVIIRESG